MTVILCDFLSVLNRGVKKPLFDIKLRLFTLRDLGKNGVGPPHFIYIFPIPKSKFRHVLRKNGRGAQPAKYPFVAALACVFGHIVIVFLHFKGGGGSNPIFSHGTPKFGCRDGKIVKVNLNTNIS